MRKAGILLSLSFAALCAAQDLPSVDKVLDKYVEALGGKAALEKVSSRYVKGTVDVTTYNVSGTFEAFEKAPSRRLLRSEFEGYGLVVQSCDGTAAWMETPDNGHRDLSGAELAAQKRAADFNHALNMKQHYAKMAVTGKAKVGAREGIIVEATPAEGAADKLTFDAENGLLLRTETPSPEGAVSVAYEDYKDVDGIKISHIWKIDMPNVSLVYKTAEVKHGVAIEDGKFKPAGK